MYGRRGKDNPNYRNHYTEESKRKIGDNTLVRIWINEGVFNRRVNLGDLDKYISSDHVLGQLKRKGIVHK